MNEKRILDLLGQIDDKYIMESAPTTGKLLKRNFLKWGTIAACFCLLIVGAIFGKTYYTEASYISIDVNPSLELCLNPYNKVISACAYNEEAERILASLDLSNKSYTEAISCLMENEDFATYLDENADLTITIISDKESELTTGITGCSDYIQKHGIFCTSDYTTRQEAHAQGCSTGKYEAYQKLLQYDATVTLDDCKEMSMHEIHERTEECKLHHETNSSGNNSSTHHSGSHHCE